MEYTLSLALVDFLPVSFSAVGFAYIVRMVSHVLPWQGNVALLGAVLIVAGGFSRALWKLFMASSGGMLDIDWLEDCLFVLMAPGFSILAWSVWQASRFVQGKRIFGAWLVPFVFIVFMFVTSYLFFRSRPDSPAWERVLLSVMVIATVITGVLLILFAFRRELPMAGWLFMINLVGIFILNGAARLPVQPISLQWIEEGINTVSWLAFAMAAWTVYQHVRVNFGVDATGFSQLSKTAE